MTVTDFNFGMKKFFSECMNIMDTKGREYARNTEVLTDVRELAHALGVTVAGILFVYMWKHVTAIRYFVRNGSVKTESIRGRLLDAANYCGMIAVVLEVGEENLFKPGIVPIVRVDTREFQDKVDRMADALGAISRSSDEESFTESSSTDR